MSKRTDSIRSMFSVPQGDALSADNNTQMLPRVSAGSVRSLRDTFSEVERENDELRAQLASSHVAVDLDPELVDPSPLADRFTDQGAEPFDALKTSIQERGQEMPILVREHPTATGRYQSAYGHRRVRVAKELGIPVKAYIRALSDEDLVVAQGIENSARDDLSFIERAVFAVRLEDAGFQRSVIQTALTVDRAEVSKLISVAQTIPRDVIEAIGRAPKVGRGRWQALADSVTKPAMLKRVRAAALTEKFTTLATDARFVTLLSAANKPVEHKPLSQSSQSISSSNGGEIARIAFTDTQLKLTVSRVVNEGFAAFLIDKLPDLFEAYAKSGMPEEDREA